MSDSPAQRLLSEWIERDRAVSWLPDDRRALEDALPLRQLVLELFVAAARNGPSKDLYHACIRFGGELATKGASPTLACGAFDGAHEALGRGGEALFVPEPVWWAARAALFEGYVRTSRELAERASFGSWEPPRCFVIVEPGWAAVSAGHPSSEADVLSAWAGRVAGALMVRAVRRAHVAGEGRALAAVLDALSEAGIASVSASPPQR